MKVLKLSVLAAAILLGAGTTFAGNTKGWYDGCCDIVVLHFTRYSEQTAGRILELRSGGMPIRILAGEGWYTVKGRLCGSTGHCEETGKAEIQVERVTGKRVWGQYSVEVNGQHLTAHFSVKYKGPRCICE